MPLSLPPLHATLDTQPRTRTPCTQVPLLPTQARQLIELLLGCAPLPEPELDYDAFDAALAAALDGAGKVYDPLQRRMRPWADRARMRRCFDPARARGLACCRAGSAEHGASGCVPLQCVVA